MTCAKRHVECHLEFPDGRTIVGTNTCNNPQETCPRKPGEGYEKCRSVCDQFAHAEIVALYIAGGYAPGATAKIYGHSKVCEPCMDALRHAGVIRVVME